MSKKLDELRREYAENRRVIVMDANDPIAQELLNS